MAPAAMGGSCFLVSDEHELAPWRWVILTSDRSFWVSSIPASSTTRMESLPNGLMALSFLAHWNEAGRRVRCDICRLGQTVGVFPE